MASSLVEVKEGAWVEVAGLVLSRQQPATASGVVFVTLEDESGICNLIVQRPVFEAHRRIVRHAPMLLAAGKLERQKVAANATPVIHVLVRGLEWLTLPDVKIAKVSRDFH